MSECLVLWWRYGDGSGVGIIRAYQDERRASDDMALLAEVMDGKEYKLERVAFYPGDMGAHASQASGEHEPFQISRCARIDCNVTVRSGADGPCRICAVVDCPHYKRPVPTGFLKAGLR